MGFVASHTPTVLASGLYKGQVPGAVTPLLQKNAETNVIHQLITYSTTLTKVLGPPTGTLRYVHGQGQAFGGPRTTGTASTTRPPPKAEIVVG